jgi:hypothetical protein
LRNAASRFGWPEGSPRVLVKIVNIDDTAPTADGGNVAKPGPLLRANAPTPRNPVLAWSVQ